MNNKEIEAIEDRGLRKIYMKFWNLKREAFLDEHGIPDHQLGQVWDELSRKEELEVAAYLAKKD